MYGVYTVFLAGKSPKIRSYTMYIYGSGQPYICDMAGTIDGCADTSKTKHRTHKIEHADAGLGAWIVVHMHVAGTSDGCADTSKTSTAHTD